MGGRLVIAVAAGIAVVVGVVLAAATWGAEPDPTSAGARTETHTVVARTTLVGPPVYYFEGALVRVGLWPDGDPDWYDAHRTAPMSVGEDVTWVDVPAGEYDLVGEVFPCSGNCGELGPRVDACSLPLELGSDVDVVVRFRWVKACEIHVKSS